jgi:hypothetical protein|tara:strand:+ start:10574 stop:10840 length:267 start_codon:yes stop_codon:yes gene_type:complete
VALRALRLENLRAYEYESKRERERQCVSKTSHVKTQKKEGMLKEILHISYPWRRLLRELLQTKPSDVILFSVVFVPLSSALSFDEKNF